MRGCAHGFAHGCAQVAEEKKKRSEARTILALFSNPAAPQQLQLKPLQLGQELKFLMRAVPQQELVCEPAASFEDVADAIKRCGRPPPCPRPAPPSADSHVATAHSPSQMRPAAHPLLGPLIRWLAGV